MKEVGVKINIDSKEATDNLKDIEKGIDDVGDAAKKTSEEVEDVGKSAKKSKKGFKSMSTGIKAVGTALKAAGIGLIIGLVAGLTDAFSRNKKVMDTISIVMGTIQQVFSQVTDAIISTYQSIAKSSENFDALGRVISGLVTIGLTPLKLTFYGLKLAVQEVQLAWEKSFFGDKDPETIASLNLAIIETKGAILEVGEAAIDAGKDVVTNFGEAVGEFTNIAKVAVTNLSKVSIAAANEQAKINKLAQDGAVIAEAQAGRLVAQYDRQAEKLRQLRDDDAKSIKDRQKSNNELIKVLENQESALLDQADAVIAGANAELQKNDSIENQAALISALAAKEQVLADIEGKRSEQKANDVALLREEKDLITAVTDAESERAKIQAEFDAEQLEDPLEKLEAQRLAFENENILILEDIEAKRELYAEGTQARVDAEQDYLNRKQSIDNNLIANDKATNAELVKNQKITSESKTKIENQYLNSASKAIGVLASLSEENKDLQAASIVATNAVGIASSIINTTAANARATLDYGVIPAAPVIAANYVSMGVGIAASIAATAKGLSALGKGGDSGSAPAAPTAAAPSFNLVEGSEGNQIQESINNQNSNPIKAYVVSGDVTTAQSLDRNIEDEAGI